MPVSSLIIVLSGTHNNHRSSRRRKDDEENEECNLGGERVDVDEDAAVVEFLDGEGGEVGLGFAAEQGSEEVAAAVAAGAFLAGAGVELGAADVALDLEAVVRLGHGRLEQRIQTAAALDARGDDVAVGEAPHEVGFPAHRPAHRLRGAPGFQRRQLPQLHPPVLHAWRCRLLARRRRLAPALLPLLRLRSEPALEHRHVAPESRWWQHHERRHGVRQQHEERQTPSTHHRSDRKED
mmetsp:Transcript_4900/g.15402  ORF Transcript_4900/g.15402 Transcript_4900/m.15402 type:complete len:237 (-) Transcript_4900:7-717(-)